MKRCFIPFIATIGILLLCRCFVSSPETEICRFFEKYGYKLSQKPIEVMEYTLPKEMDETLLRYNLIQTKIGLDITPYLGKEVIRYTYTVENYPTYDSSPVRANALLYKNKVIAADIMTVSSDGFMISPGEEIG